MTPQKLKIHVRFNKRKKVQSEWKEKKVKKNPNHEHQHARNDKAKGCSMSRRAVSSKVPPRFQITPICTPGAATSVRHGSPTPPTPPETHKTQFNLESRQHTGW